MDDDRGAAIAKDGMIVVAECYVRSDYRNVGGAVGGDNEREIRDVSRGRTVMMMLGAAGVEMGASRLEVWRIAQSDLVNVDGMLAGRKIFDVKSDLDAVRRAGKKRRSNTLAFGILEFYSDRFGRGAAVRILRQKRGS